MLTDWLMVIITLIYVVATIRIYNSNRQSVQAVKDQTDVLQQQLAHQIAQEKNRREKELLDIYNVEYIKTGRKITSIKFYVRDLEPRTYKFETKKDFDKPKKEVKKILG